MEGLRVGKLSGAVGQYAAIDPEVERIACERLGLEPAPSSTQILQRDRHAELLSALALAALVARSVCDGDPAPRAHRGARGRGAVRRAARRALGDAAQAQPDHGRADLRAWPASCARMRSSGSRTSRCGTSATSRTRSAERVVLPDSFLALDYALDRFAWLVEGLVVRPERMRANVEASHGLFFSQRLLLALVASGLARDDAYRLVQRHAMRAWDEELDFRELVRGDAEIAGRVDLDAIFALDAYTAHVDTVFERLRALVATREAATVP